MNDPTKPNLGLLCKLGSLIVHVEEAISEKGHAFDRIAAEQLMADPEVRAWRKAMGPFLPVKR